MVFFKTKDMQTPHNHPYSSPLRSSHIYIEDAHSAESNEKSYIRFFRFLFFELWLIIFKIYGDTLSVPPTTCSTCSKLFKSDHWSNNNLSVHEFFWETFSFWDVVDFVYDRPYTKSTISQKLKVAEKKSWVIQKSFWKQCASFLKF